MLKEVDKTSSPRAGRRKLDDSDSPRHILLQKTSRFAGRFSVANKKKTVYDLSV